MTATTTLLSLLIKSDLSVSLTFSASLIIVAVILLIILLIVKLISNRGWRSFEIDETQIGIGSHSISFKPNVKDREVAYKIWVELSTRKIGLPINLEHDVISEVYDSWYGFFSITRELIKDIPVNKLRNDSTRKLVNLSVSILNEGLRPHLTLWQARFRHWYDKKIEANVGDFDPQAVQAEYPKFSELKEDLLKVNDRLIKYREKMKELVLGLPQSDKKLKKKASL